MMEEVLRQLTERKSVRVFEEQPVSEEMRQQLIEAALQAPTAGNQTLYTVLDVRRQDLKDALAVSCDNQPFIAAAPVVYVFVADCRRWHDAYRYAGAEPRKPGVGDLLLACADALIAAQNTVVAAHAMGLGSCYIGDILENRERHVQLLGLDEYTVPVCMVVYGWPTEQQKKRPKPTRFEAQYIVQQDTYRRLGEGEMREMFQKASGQESFDFDEYVRAFCKRKYMSDFSLEMTRSVAEYLKEFVPFGEREKI